MPKTAPKPQLTAVAALNPWCWVLAPRFEALTELLRDAARRGEVSPERLTPMVLEVLHALILKHTLLEARDPTKKDITEMIDEVLLPLLVATPI
jgi:hypothetical protein